MKDKDNIEQLKPAQEASILKGLAEQFLNKEINYQDFVGAVKELEQPANDNSTKKEEISKTEEDKINAFLDELEKKDIETVLKKSHANNYLETSFKFYSDDKFNIIEDLEIPKGGLSLVCGATGHGKTFFLNQLLLDLVHKHKDKTFYFISYEESEENIYLKMFLIYLSNYRIVDEFSKNHLKTLKHYLNVFLEKEEGNKSKFITQDDKLNELEVSIEKAFEGFKKLKNQIKIITPDSPNTQELINLMMVIQKENQTPQEAF